MADKLDIWRSEIADTSWGQFFVWSLSISIYNLLQNFLRKINCFVYINRTSTTLVIASNSWLTLPGKKPKPGTGVRWPSHPHRSDDSYSSNILFVWHYDLVRLVCLPLLTLHPSLGKFYQNLNKFDRFSWLYFWFSKYIAIYTASYSYFYQHTVFYSTFCPCELWRVKRLYFRHWAQHSTQNSECGFTYIISSINATVTVNCVAICM